MRLGVVPYFNSLPLVHGIPCEIYKAVPAELVSVARADDIILGPIAAAFSDPSWWLIEGVGIGSFGAVETVKLFFKNSVTNVQNLKTIYLDADSVTSAGLLQVLLQNFFQRPLDGIQFTRENVNAADARLLIGDKVFEENEKSPHIDLGEAWTNFTRLPFIYACWMTRNTRLAQEWKPKLIAQARHNLERLEILAETIPPEKRKRILSYWRRLHYPLDPQEKKGIEKFQGLWAEAVQKPNSPLRWV